MTIVVIGSLLKMTVTTLNYNFGMVDMKNGEETW